MILMIIMKLMRMNLMNQAPRETKIQKVWRGSINEKEKLKSTSLLICYIDYSRIRRFPLKRLHVWRIIRSFIESINRINIIQRKWGRAMKSFRIWRNLLRVITKNKRMKTMLCKIKKRLMDKVNSRWKNFKRRLCNFSIKVSPK
jgi:hypothetical protein